MQPELLSGWAERSRGAHDKSRAPDANGRALAGSACDSALIAMVVRLSMTHLSDRKRLTGAMGKLPQLGLRMSVLSGVGLEDALRILVASEILDVIA
ncbi:hypothetical protein [Metallibacterium scheffleri]|uniref:hypothetical protein n=1 Tax=Metallibacterium scheffleri TaxID=993689 RepID=UPI001447CCFE|nr:hypothetical protein [Metallibacterium scheffleri]